VLAEMGDFKYDGKARSTISAEVVSRQRAQRTAERRGHVIGQRPPEPPSTSGRVGRT